MRSVRTSLKWFLLWGLALGSSRPMVAAEFFDGVGDAGQPIMQQARQQIEQIRKGEFTIRMVKPDGSPIVGKTRIRLISHEFHFGANLTAISDKLTEDSPARASAFQVVEELFNFIRVGNFWRHMAPTRDGPLNWERVDRDVKWARQRSLPMRFHCLIYNVSDALPSWYHEIKTTEEWWPLIEGRIRATAERYGSVIHEYDVINEMILSAAGAKRDRPIFPALDDPQNGARIMRLARKYLPDAKLVSLETGLAATTGKTTGHFLDALNYQKALLATGAPVDVIGYQGHFHASKTPFIQKSASDSDIYQMTGINAGFEQLALLGKPVHITEFSGPSRSSSTKQGRNRLPGISPEEVAAWVVNFYTLAFSKPNIQELVCWNVVDGVGGQAIDAGLVAKDGTKKSLYYALRKLIKEDWSSQWEGNLNDGAAQFRGFFGRYQVTVEGYEPALFTVTASGQREVHCQLKPISK